MKTTQFINSSFLLNNADNFLLKDNTIFQSQINERMIRFSLFKSCFEMSTGYIFIFLIYNTLRAIFGLFFSKPFQSSFPDA